MTRLERAANRRRWQSEIEAWQASGKSLSVWSRERGLSRDALQYWKSRLVKQRAQGKGDASTAAGGRAIPLTLIPVTTVSAGAVPIELSLGRCRLLLRSGFDAVALGQILDVLEGRC